MKLKDFVSVEDCLWPTEGLVLLASARHTSLDPLDDDVPFKLSHSTKDREDHFAHRRRGIDGLVEADELDIEGLELFQGSDQVACTAGEPIEPGDQDSVDLTTSGCFHQPIESWSAILGPADSNVCALGLDCEASMLGIFPQRH